MTFHAWTRKSFLFLYRAAAVVVLYGILFGIVCYVSTMLFFCLSPNWVAPVLISPSNTTILSLTASLVTSQQAVDGFVLDESRQRVTVAELSAQKAALEKLNQELGSDIRRARQNDFASGEELDALSQQKHRDIATTGPLVRDAAKVSHEIDSDLAAGLISKSDAATAKATLNQFSNAFTDDQIAEVNLHDVARQKTQIDFATMDALAQHAQISAAIAQMAVQITTGLEQLKSDEAQVVRLQDAMKVARETPYYRASISPNQLAFAFVSYSNQQNIHVGSVLYDCYLGIVGCYQVGTVERVFTDEEQAVHPIFHNQIRGSLVQLVLTRKSAAKSTVLFVNHKPLGWF